MGPVAVIGVTMGILFVMLYLVGLGAGSGITHILTSIPIWGWIIILFFVLMLFGRKK